MLFAKKKERGYDCCMKLEKVFTMLSQEQEVRAFLRDLLSPKEYESLVERWRVVELLEKGHSYREIAEITGVSTATVTRVSKCLNAPKSGYRLALNLPNRK